MKIKIKNITFEFNAKYSVDDWFLTNALTRFNLFCINNNVYKNVNINVTDQRAEWTPRSRHASKLKVWYIPQVPMRSFEINVHSPEEALDLMELISEFSCVMFENKLRPDYTDCCGLITYCHNYDEWVEWYNEDDFDVFEYEQCVLIG